MSKIIMITVFSLIYSLTNYAQTNVPINVEQIEIILNEKVEGIGPRGLLRIGISPKNKMDELELTACPKMKNIPATLSNIVEYCFYLNKFQFFYQNYRSGVFPKDYFFNEATKQKWNLKDTIQLTEKNLKNTISIVTGIDSDGNQMYIVDTQNNSDFGDDAVKIMISSHKEEEIISNSFSVDIDYFDGKSVKKETQLIFGDFSQNSKVVSFRFPQFRYSKFKYKNKNYFVSAESLNDQQSIFLLNERPCFSSQNDKEIKPLQFVELDGDYFQYFPKSSNSERILLKKVPKPKEETSLVASQIAMIAPEIMGVNILDNLKISLNSLKGKYVFLDFWSTTCAPCIAEFPNIKEVYEKIDRNQLEIIGIVEDRTGGEIKEFIQNKNLIWPNIQMNIKSTTMQGYSIKSFPTTYLIDPNGVIIAINLRGNDLLNKLQFLKIKK
jgi:thiol-disulfide isomerase/thioredoxin